MDQSLSARPELLQVADTVARDKGIERDEVLEAMEQAIQKAGRSKYGLEYDIRAEIDRRNGEIRLMRFRGRIEAVDAEDCVPVTEEAGRFLLPFTDIIKAKLMLTDDLLAASQNDHTLPPDESAA